MVMDQAGWHRGKDLEVPENMRLEGLPPYSPQCNPVEHIWDELREKRFSNRVFQSLDGVETTLIDALENLENDKGKIQSFTGFDWIIGIPMNAS